MRSTPAIEADNIVGRLQPGQQVHVLARDGDWQQVRSENGLFGWSHSDYLIDLPPRQLGDKRLFSYPAEETRQHIGEQEILLYIGKQETLQYIGKHSYIYIAENDFGSERPIDPVWLQRLGQLFDNRIYTETSKLWNASIIPSHEGDERIVILITRGGGGYYARTRMPQEPNPTHDRVGFIQSYATNGLTNDSDLYGVAQILVHELQHLFEHQVHHGNEEQWVRWAGEGLASFGTLYLGYEDISFSLANEFFDWPQTQLTDFSYETYHYGASMLFTTYIYEQLGLEAWQSFATHPARGLAALAAVLTEIGSDRNVDSFFADWVLANYLHELQLTDPRYRYRLLESESLNVNVPIIHQYIVQLPARIQDSSNQYATHYYDLSILTSDQKRHLTLALQLANPSVQDAWLQLVQSIDGEVQLQRFRASEFRNQTINATLEAGTEHSFLAISPFRTDDRSLTEPTRYDLEIHLAGSDVDGVDHATNSVEPDAVTKPSEQRSPLQLATKIDAILDKIIENRNRIRAEGAENRIGEYIPPVEELIAAGAAVDGAIGGSFLTKVVRRIQSPALLAVFLENGADPNRGEKGTWLSIPGIIGSYPANPLNYAVYFGDTASLKLLIDAGAIVDNAALRLASTGGAKNSGDTRIISMLLADGTDSRITASGLRAAAEVARQRRHHAKAEMLEAAAEKMN